MSEAQAAKANFWSRIGATLVDGVILVVIYAVLLGLAIALDSAVAAVIGILVYLLAGFFYAPLLMARSGANNGQTWGRQIVGVRVVSVTGAPIGMGTSFLREFVGKSLFYTFSLYICLIIDLVMGFTSPNGQTLHDKVASTVVLNAGASPALATAVANLSLSAGPGYPEPPYPEPPYPPPPGGSDPWGSQPPPPPSPPSLQK